MSLLIDALKKAEQAKLSVEQTAMDIDPAIETTNDKPPKTPDVQTDTIAFSLEEELPKPISNTPKTVKQTEQETEKDYAYDWVDDVAEPTLSIDKTADAPKAQIEPIEEVQAVSQPTHVSAHAAAEKDAAATAGVATNQQPSETVSNTEENSLFTGFGADDWHSKHKPDNKGKTTNNTEYPDTALKNDLPHQAMINNHLLFNQTPEKKSKKNNLWLYVFLLLLLSAALSIAYYFYVQLMSLSQGSSITTENMMLHAPPAGTLQKQLNTLRLTQKSANKVTVITETQIPLKNDATKAIAIDAEKIIPTETVTSKADTPSSEIIAPTIENQTKIVKTPAQKKPKPKPKLSTQKPAHKMTEKIILDHPDKGFYIQRQQHSAGLNPSIQQAYAHFQAGRNQQAKLQYQKVLAEDKGNRDALLGMAALALRHQDTAQAAAFYRQVLHLYPDDPFAETGLMAARDEKYSNKNSESHLQARLAQDAQSHILHFALGNLYSQQGRWSEAQQAYFNAFRYHNQHADYAFNLAISLDHLGKKPAALDFYRQALKLMKNEKTVSFNPSKVHQRIRVLVGQ